VNLHEMLARSQEFDIQKEDYLSPLEDITFTEKGVSFREKLFGTALDLEMTDWALGQVCDKLGPPPRHYMEVCPGELRAHNLNHWKEVKKSNGGWLIRTHEEKARAVLSKDYTIMNNTEVLSTMIDIMGDTVYEPVQPFISPDAAHVKIKVTHNNDGNYGQGVYIGNGETGNYKLRVLPFVQRTSCTNSIIWKGGGIELRHWRVGRIDLMYTIKRFMGEALNKTADMMDKIIEAELEFIPEFAEYVKKFCKDNQVSEVGYGMVMAGTESVHTRMALVNGLTYYAHEQKDYNDQLRLETLGANILMGNQEPTQL